MGLFGNKRDKADSDSGVSGSFEREVSELLRLNASDDDVAAEEFTERNLSKSGFAQAVVHAGIDFWAVDDYGSALDLLQTLDLVLIGNDDLDTFPASMRAEIKTYIAWSLAMLGLEDNAIDVWRDAVEWGSVEANYLLYLYLPEGSGLEELRAAAAAGHEKAMQTLAELGDSSDSRPASSGNGLGGGKEVGLSLATNKVGVGSAEGTSPIGVPASSTASARFCEQCGSERSEGAVFCGACGVRFSA